MSRFLVDLLSQCVQCQRLGVMLGNKIQQDAHNLALVVSFLGLKICKNLGEELFCQLFLLVLTAYVSVRVELQDLLQNGKGLFRIFEFVGEQQRAIIALAWQ